MTLGFNWATLTNYGTGPDIGSATKIDPASSTNGFIAGTVAAPQHVNFLINLIADQLADAVDGVGGGTYNLASDLLFQGAGEVQFGALVRVATGATLVTDTGSSLIANGGAEFNGIIFTATLDDSEDLKIDDSSDGWRLTLTPQSIQPDGSSLPSWTPRFSGDIHAGVTSGWQQDDVSAPFTIVFPINLPPGDDILTIDVSVNGSSTSGTGGHTNKPTGTDLPSVALVQVDAQGNATVIARRFDHASNVASYNVDHVIQLLNGSLTAGTLPHTVTNDAYYIVVKGETGADAVAGEYAVTGVSGTCISRAYRSALMVY